jgi:hypothetical protein
MTESGNIQASRSARIAALNDAFRQSFCGGDVYITRGVAALPVAEQAALVTKVQRFDDFHEGNDPYGHHDFGRIIHGGEPYYWKIDYYDKARGLGDDARGVDCPTNPKTTLRVLTILRADEY